MLIHLHIFLAAFMLRWKSWVVTAEAVWTLEPKLFTICPLQKKFTNLWSKAMISKVNSDKWFLGIKKKILEILFLVLLSKKKETNWVLLIFNYS